jgi:peroxiredoxin
VNINQLKLVVVNNMRMSRHLQLKQQATIFLVMVVMSCFSNVRADSQAEKTQGGIPAPGFELQDMKGQEHQLKAYVGQTVIVNFWAVWCAPCRKEIPAMNRALAILNDENIAMLGINVGDQQEAIEAFSEDFPMDFTVLMDKTGAVSQHWQVIGFPTTFIINSQGEIVHRLVGDREWDEKNMLDSVRSVAAN